MPSKPRAAADFTDAPSIAAMLFVNKRTLRRLIVTGQFPKADLQLSKTLLRWRLATVNEWIEQNAQGEGRTR